MLRTRLWMGSLLAAIAGAVLFVDPLFAPWFPCLFLAFQGLGILAVREMLGLQPEADRAGRNSSTIAVLVTLASNWYVPLASAYPDLLPRPAESWYPVLITATGSIFAAFCIEMIKYRTPGHSVPRVANTIMIVVYLGVLPSFLLKLRWLRPEFASLMLGMTVFVPKVGDIGAYFAGRLLGRTPFSPWLSPKKTWEGFFGGLALAVVAAVLLAWLGREAHDGVDLLRYGLIEAALLGLVLAIAGVLGDLAESMLKRDSRAKDASRSIPGFGGVLDVIDSVLFAGPVAYLWFSLSK